MSERAVCPLCGVMRPCWAHEGAARVMNAVNPVYPKARLSCADLLRELKALREGFRLKSYGRVAHQRASAMNECADELDALIRRAEGQP